MSRMTKKEGAALRERVIRFMGLNEKFRYSAVYLELALDQPLSRMQRLLKALWREGVVRRTIRIDEGYLYQLSKK